MENNKRKINKDNNSVNDFLYAFGMKKTSNNDSIESPMDFAYAMGVSRYTGKKPERKVQPVSAPIPTKLKYV